MMLTIFQIIALIMSAVVHEVAHGYMAYRLGDDTAKDLGRLTLNPIKHLDPIGSVLLPLIFTISGARFFIAWAKPVPFNPYNFTDSKNGPMKVALAGPASNLVILVVFGLFAKFLPLAASTKTSLLQAFFMQGNSETMALMAGSLASSLYVMSLIICLVNAVLMVFNLIPIPPLDGSKVLLRFMNEKGRDFFYRYETYGIFVVLILVYLGLTDIILGPVMSAILSLFF
jgi:Zn-dependent protease